MQTIKGEDRGEAKGAFRRPEPEAHLLKDGVLGEGKREDRGVAALQKRPESRARGRGGEAGASEGHSLEKALSRRPGLLGAAAAGTAVHVAVAVAGTVSGSTSLRKAGGRVKGERGPHPGPVLPAGTHR